MPKIFVQGTLVKARLSIEKPTISPSWHLNAPLSSVTPESLEVNDLSLLVQSILGTTEAAVLLTTEQADNMIVSRWQTSKVFDTGNPINTVNGGNTVNAVNGGNTDTGASKKRRGGGGCVYNFPLFIVA
jgi:hypothetical protein